mmetsp:Transcript_46056/g.97739  ORF Transcript_46056/g.97739 Transcript_46056/m.97739 type:complete len:118 (-) Transcript_46056:366-719(-)
MMATQIPGGVTNELVGESDSASSSNKKIESMGDKTAADGDAPPPARRKPSRRSRGTQASSLSNSLRADRLGGLASTQGRLSVSFRDIKGLDKALIGDILSDGDDEKKGAEEDIDPKN